jgi:hypothetical protein
MYADFLRKYECLDDQKMQMDEVVHAIDTYKTHGLSKLSDAEFHDYLNLLDMHSDLQKTIRRVQHKSEEVEYMLDTADIVFKYYDILEKGNDMDQEHVHHVKSNSILKYFMTSHDAAADADVPSGSDGGGDVGGNNSAVAKPQTYTNHHSSHMTTANMTNCHQKVAGRVGGKGATIVGNNNEEDRASLLERYMEKTDSNYFKPIVPENSDVCPICESTDRVLLPNDGLCYCNNCFSIETVIIDHEKPSYKDPPKEITYFAYKRINHLNEWISQIQGKESTDIPVEIYDKILLEIRKQRITNMADITATKIREILKRLSLNKYYEHTPHIMNRLNGSPSISLTPEIEEKLRQMFKMIQIPFFKYAPKSRKNFLSYSYTIHKCLQLLELDAYLKFFPLLKSREKTFQMDEVWQKICQELNWQFIASV